jgi:hypothetical protein
MTPKVMIDGTPVVAELPIRNTNRVVGTMLGSEVTRRWGRDGLPPIRLSYHWLTPSGTDAVFNGLRTPLPHDLPPGAELLMPLTVEAPAEPGVYLFQLALDLTHAAGAVDALDSKIDVGEWPAWTGRAPESAVLAYRYVRPGYRLLVEARRYAEAEVLQALVDNARFTTVVSDDGQTMTEASLSVRNNGRQHLEIELPKGATVWSAFVAGEPVRPSQREGRLLLPLERTSASDAPITVELTYVGEDMFPRRSGTVRSSRR